jgi:ABC-2 type transport system ATP-binding protein
MRYRLGFAQALLGRPDLVILDEPLTGLDPLHVREVRAAVAGLADAGATVLMSSHVLSEVEQVCTHAAVLQRGRLVASGSLAELVGSAGRSLEDAYVDLVREPAAEAGGGDSAP